MAEKNLVIEIELGFSQTINVRFWFIIYHSWTLLVSHDWDLPSRSEHQLIAVMLKAEH